MQAPTNNLARADEPYRAAHTPLLVWLIALGLAVIIAVTPLGSMASALGLALAATLPLLNPVFGVYLAVLSVPVQELRMLPGGLSYTQAAVLLAAGGWGLSLVARPGRILRSQPNLASVAPWAVLLLALLLSASLTPYSRTEGLKETARWGAAFLIWLIAVATLQRPWQIWGLVACLLLAPAANALIGITQFITGDGPPTFRIAPELPYVRAYGTIGQPNSFAGYLNMAWPLALSVATYDLRFWILDLRNSRQASARSRRPKLRLAGRLLISTGLWATTGVLLAGLAASFSRGAWLGAAAGVLGLAAALSVAIVTQDQHSATKDGSAPAGVPYGRRSLVIGLWACLLGAAVAVALLGRAGLLPEPVAARAASIGRSIGFFDASATEVTPENFAVVERMAHIQAGLAMLQSHPVTGVGPGNYSVAYPDFAVGEWYVSRGHAHNYYLHIAAEAGALGLTAYLLLLSTLVVQGGRAVRATAGTTLQGVAVGCCGMIVAVMGHNLFENLHVLNMGIQLAGVWALMFALPIATAGAKQQ